MTKEDLRRRVEAGLDVITRLADEGDSAAVELLQKIDELPPPNKRSEKKRQHGAFRSPRK